MNSTRAHQVILGVDPGWRTVGYGVIRSDGTHNQYLDGDCLQVGQYEGMQRLHYIFHGIEELVRNFLPAVLAIEEVFLARNPMVALKLGQARGAAVAAAGHVKIVEYSPRRIKQAVTGTGGANKEQVAYMVQRLLCIRKKMPADVSDALAVALCHAHSSGRQIVADTGARRPTAAKRR